MNVDRFVRVLLATSIFLSSVVGCHTGQLVTRTTKHSKNKLASKMSQLQCAEDCVDEPPVARQISTPIECSPREPLASDPTRPLSVDMLDEPIDWPLSLEQAVQITLENSDVIRDLGGRLVASPQAASSVYDVALREMDPAFGVEAALSDFDTRLTSSMIFDRDEQAFNNQFFGGGASNLATNRGDFNLELAKRAATGTQISVRNITNYNRNDSPVNLFRSAYDTQFNAEVRQPLLRGAGVNFNRIAGPNAQPGNYNGVVLARIRTDIALADFETSVRNLIRDVEQAYWQLYFSYRSLEARQAAYDAALASWRTVQKQYEASVVDGEQEALAQANYYLALSALKNALGGGPASSGIVGVYSSERNLRKLMGVQASDGRLILPTDEPSTAKRIFDWEESLSMGLDRRVELRRQRWTVKQRESELVAAKNFLLSQLDMIALYRWRGFGDDLLGNADVPAGSAFETLYGGDLQGWQLGLQYSVALGKRREHAAVRSAELNLAREKSILRNQELDIGNNIASQFAELDRAYSVARVNFNRSLAERRRLEAARSKYDAGTELLEFVLQAQQTTADADTQYYRSLVDYTTAVMQFHYERGSYLKYMNVQLEEGPWSPEAYCSYKKEFRRFKPKMNYCMTSPPPVSNGAQAGAAMSYAPVVQGDMTGTIDSEMMDDTNVPGYVFSTSDVGATLVGGETLGGEAIINGDLSAAGTTDLSGVVPESVESPPSAASEMPLFGPVVGSEEMQKVPSSKAAPTNGNQPASNKEWKSVESELPVEVPTKSTLEFAPAGKQSLGDLFSQAEDQRILRETTHALSSAADAVARILRAESEVDAGPRFFGRLDRMDVGSVKAHRRTLGAATIEKNNGKPAVKREEVRVSKRSSNYRRSSTSKPSMRRFEQLR